MEPLISVIVPVYKVEQYLDECVQSIINQTYKNLEIILVDDGSPDRCPEMCDEYARQDSRIKVIHKKNGGLSSARNVGIEVASGEYIGFVDSDDFIASDMYEKLYASIKGEKDDVFAVKCRYKRYINGQIVSSFFHDYNTDTIVPSDKYLVSLVSDYFAPNVWEFLIKRKYVFVRFVEGKNAEDLLFCYQLGDYIERNRLSLKLITDELYYYRDTRESISNNQTTPFFISVIDNCEYIYNDSILKGSHEVAESIYAKYAATVFSLNIQIRRNTSWQTQYYREYHNKLKRLKWSKFLHFWGVRHKIGLIIVTYFPCLLVPGVISFITKHEEIPPNK